MNVYHVASYHTTMLGNKPTNWCVFAKNCGEAREFLRLYLDSIGFKYNYFGFAFFERHCKDTEENSLFVIDPYQIPMYE